MFAGKPRIRHENENLLTATHETLGRFFFAFAPRRTASPQSSALPRITRPARRALFRCGQRLESARQGCVSQLCRLRSRRAAFNPKAYGTKARAALPLAEIPGGESQTIELPVLYAEAEALNQRAGT